MSGALERIERIKALRRAGHTFSEIATRTNVSISTAHAHAKNMVPIEESRVPNKCGRPRGKLNCQRMPGHDGVHMANDKKRRLIYWE